MAMKLCRCGNIIQFHNKCDKCYKPSPRVHRKTTAERGYDSKWKSMSQRIRKERVICEDCEKHGLVRIATECHHIHKIKSAPHLRLAKSNVIALCASCHRVRTERGE